MLVAAIWRHPKTPVNIGFNLFLNKTTPPLSICGRFCTSEVGNPTHSFSRGKRSLSPVQHVEPGEAAQKAVEARRRQSCCPLQGESSLLPALCPLVTPGTTLRKGCNVLFFMKIKSVFDLQSIPHLPPIITISPTELTRSVIPCCITPFTLPTIHNLS